MGRDLTTARRGELQAARKNLQIVFQDPLASLPSRVVRRAEPKSGDRPRHHPQT
jgi:ABC-type microcin C transport system duplicated ATPase subunit YejF